MVSREEVDTYMKKFVDSMEAPEDKANAYMQEFVNSMQVSEDPHKKAKRFISGFVDKADEFTYQPQDMADRLRLMIMGTRTPQGTLAQLFSYMKDDNITEEIMTETADSLEADEIATKEEVADYIDDFAENIDAPQSDVDEIKSALKKFLDMMDVLDNK